jgi:hypothetical protein
MALKACRECGEQICTEAKMCPSCGIKSPARKPIGCLGALGVAFGIVVVLGIIGKIITPNQPDVQQRAPITSAKTTGKTKAKDTFEDGLIQANSLCASTVKLKNAVGGVIRYSGYDCSVVDAMCRYAFSEGYTVYCNNARYRFEVENHGGKWSVTPN